MDDDVERIDLVDDFHANRPARMKPLRTVGVGPCSYRYFLPASLARRVFSAEPYKPSEKDRTRQEGSKPTMEPRHIRLMRAIEYGVRNGQRTDWYFTHNVP